MFRYPQLSGSTEDQLHQLKSFLYQLIDQLNHEFSIIGSTESVTTVQQNKEHNNITEKS